MAATLCAHIAHPLRRKVALTRGSWSQDSDEELYYWPMQEVLRRYHPSNTALSIANIMHGLAYCTRRLVNTLVCRHRSTRPKTVQPGKHEEFLEKAQGTPPQEVWRAIGMVWPELFESALGPLPDLLDSSCCAQFVVSADRIRQRSLQFYEKVWCTV
jgi:hypothetical protein